MNKRYIKITDKGKLEVNEKYLDDIEDDEKIGIVDEKSKHLFETHIKCDSPDCSICDCGKQYCLICGAEASSLTSHCCEEVIEKKLLKKIANGELDYKYGKWLWGIKTSFQSQSKEDIILNQKRILKTLKEEQPLDIVALQKAYYDLNWLLTILTNCGMFVYEKDENSWRSVFVDERTGELIGYCR